MELSEGVRPEATQTLGTQHGATGFVPKMNAIRPWGDITNNSAGT
jgi:hypothetical protein